MTDEKGYQGWTNYPIWCIHLWITHDDEAYIYWTKLAQKLSNEHHATAHLRDELQDQITAAMPKLEGMWSDLMTHTLDEVNWKEIAEALLEDKQREEKTYD